MAVVASPVVAEEAVAAVAGKAFSFYRLSPHHSAFKASVSTVTKHLYVLATAIRAKS